MNKIENMRDEIVAMVTTLVTRFKNHDYDGHDCCDECRKDDVHLWVKAYQGDLFETLVYEFSANDLFKWCRREMTIGKSEADSVAERVYESVLEYYLDSSEMLKIAKESTKKALASRNKLSAFTVKDAVVKESTWINVGDTFADRRSDEGVILTNGLLKEHGRNFYKVLSVSSSSVYVMQYRIHTWYDYSGKLREDIDFSNMHSESKTDLLAKLYLGVADDAYGSCIVKRS